MISQYFHSMVICWLHLHHRISRFHFTYILTLEWGHISQSWPELVLEEVHQSVSKRVTNTLPSQSCG